MKLAERTNTIEDRMHELTKALVQHYNKQYPTLNDSISFEIECGTKYYKIMQVDAPPRSGRCVHAFVSRETGAVYKPASWKAPAKHVRYDLLDDESYAVCINNADWAGNYLYIR